MRPVFAFRLTRYGFQWGPLRVERCISDPKWGVMLHIGTDREQWMVRVTPAGRRMVISKCDEAYWLSD